LALPSWNLVTSLHGLLRRISRSKRLFLTFFFATSRLRVSPFPTGCLALALAACTVLSLNCNALAEDASVEASLSSATAEVGEAVELQVVVHGSDKAPAPEIRVDGLDIQYVGPSTQVQINNFEMSRSVTHSYNVLPQREGSFTIPALRVQAGNRSLSTQPLRLTVSGAGASAGSTGSAAAQGQPSSTEKFAFAEWVVPKTTGYVGEAIPAELRLYVANNIHCELRQLPALSGDGFTVQKMPKPSQSNITKDGRSFTLVRFKTAITPVKSGKLVLPSTDINTVAVLPVKRSARQRIPRMPGFPDVFDDPFFGQAFNTQQEVIVRPDPVELEIKPLPVVGKPRSFSGAVGQFTMTTKASPLQVHAGDPITATAEVSGMGNFDRMGPPTVVDEPGWRAYPPSSKFKEDDEVGISGIKTFEIALIPSEPKTALPRIEFSYFDPAQERYVTLTGERSAIIVEGGAIPSPTPTAAIAAAQPSASPMPAPETKPNDIHYIRVDSGRWGLAFEPVWQTQTFWLFQAFPLTALLAFVGWQWRQARVGDQRARRIAALRQGKTSALRMLEQASAASDFYDAAMRVIQFETALGSPHEPATVDAETACASRKLDPQTAAAIESLFAAHDELRYAGAGGRSGGGESITPEQRDSVRQLLERFEKSHV